MNYDSYYYNDYDAFFGGLFLVILLISLVIGLIAYVITALIYFMASKANGFADVAYIAWIPIINVYSLFLLTADGYDQETVRAIAKRNILIYAGLIIVSFIPFIGWIATIGAAGFTLYFTYRLFYRWSGETGKAVLYIILTILTGGLFFMIYGLMRMNRPFIA
ncbi:hypothetical protein I6G82_10315 [Lysinibacillus macroides]|uniref:Membrane protein n=1 Tax=Lysinibacillus macroides TaxID=33935 RepID=A0A0M9DG42_9BACI|nr:hypothetical protein [Lysinibacillus macroides]KOY80788.1 membrane protein [Lysinibacillus macroides]QPR69932.1 hypothetical protein I6G82_10315 [Lysinibacillus macroides]